MSISYLTKHSYLRSENEEPFLLSSGAKSRLYIDCRKALAAPGFLSIVSSFICANLDSSPVLIGGLSFGADPIAIASSMYNWVHQEIDEPGYDLRWFSIRKQQKNHGMANRVEGSSITKGSKVILVDDVLTTGNSLREAYGVVTELGAIVEKIIVIVERDEGFKYLEDISVPKIAMYQDKEIQRQLGKING